MSLKNKYSIDDATWQKLWQQFKLQIVWYPLTFSVLVVFIWGVTDNLSWIPAITILWLLAYLFIILFSRTWLIRSKCTLFILFIMIFSFDVFIIIMSSCCVYRFFGISGVWIQNFLLFAAGIFFSRYYYTHWEKVWISHEYHNETVALDLANGRYDYLNNFDTSEDIVKKTHKQKLSNPALINLVLAIAPIGASIPLIFSKSGDHTTPLIIVWIISIPLVLGWLKWVVAHFYMFKKLSYYERKIGKPIINGLLTESHSKKASARKKAL